MDRFDTAVTDLVEHRFEAAPEAEIFGVIRRVVLDLNEVDVRHDGPMKPGAGATLRVHRGCLGRGRIDVDALAARQRMTRHEITDEWREW